MHPRRGTNAAPSGGWREEKGNASHPIFSGLRNPDKRYMDPNGMNEKTDDEIRQIIYSRYRHIFDSPVQVFPISMNGPAIGAPPREWIPKAIDKIEELVDSGLSKNEACRRIAEEIAAAENIESKTVEMTYRRHQREHWYHEFCHYVITKDIEGAISAYKHLTPANKRKLRLI